MLRLAWPMVVIQLLQVAYNVADTFWLGRLSADAVGALSLAFPIIFLLISVGGGFTAAGSILVAQYVGAGSDESAGRVAGQTLSFVLLLATGLGALGFLLTGPALALLPTDPATREAVVPLAARYMRVFFLGTPALFGFFVFVSLMRGYGNTRTPMRVMALSVAVNVVLDPLLIFGAGPVPPLGIEGAAVATVCSRLAATVVGLYVLFGTDAGPAIRREHLVPDPAVVGRVVRLGVPSALEQSTASLAMLLMTGMVATFPPSVLAAYGLGNRLLSLVFLPAMGLGQAMNTVVGQNLGAGKPDRAERAVWIGSKVVVGVLLVVAAVAFAVPGLVVGVFLPADTPAARETVALAAQYLRINALTFAFLGVLQVMLGAFRGAGRTKTALAFSLVTLWVARLPAMYYLVFVEGWGPTGIWVAVALGDVVGAVAATAWFTRGRWKTPVTNASGDGSSPGGTTDPEPGEPVDCEPTESSPALGDD